MITIIPNPLVLTTEQQPKPEMLSSDPYMREFRKWVYDGDPLIGEIRRLRATIEATGPTDPNKLYTLDEIAEKLGMSRKKVDGLTNVTCKTTRLHVIRDGSLDGRYVRVTQQEYDDFIERRRQAAAVPPPVKRSKRH